MLVSGTTPRGESAFHVDTLDLYRRGSAAAFVKQAAEELGVKEEVDPPRPGPGAAEARRAAGRADRKGARSRRKKQITMTRRGTGRRAGAAARSALAGPYRSRTSSGAAWWARRPTSWSAIWRVVSRQLEAPLAVIVQSSVRSGQKLADGSGAGLRAGRAAGAVLGHDRPVALLHGRDRSQAQGAGHRGRRGRARARPMR